MKCKHGIDTTTGICILCRMEDDAKLHRALEQNKRPLLNPWYIEAQRETDTSICLNIVSQVTGEIRQIKLTVDDLSSIMYAGMERINALAATVDDDDRSLLDMTLRVYHGEDNHGKD